MRLPRPPRANALHYAAFKLHRHCAALLAAAPHFGEALCAAGTAQTARSEHAAALTTAPLSPRTSLPPSSFLAGNSALWASLGAQTPAELAQFNAAQALEFANSLDAQQEAAVSAAAGGGSGGLPHSLARAEGLPPAIAHVPRRRSPSAEK